MRNKNKTRARRIEKALKAYYEGMGYSAQEARAEGWKTILTDFLADARHFCDDKSGLSFHECDRVAREHYTAELSRTKAASTPDLDPTDLDPTGPRVLRATVDGNRLVAILSDGTTRVINAEPRGLTGFDCQCGLHFDDRQFFKEHAICCGAVGS